MTDICGCGRPMICHAGDLAPTCAECRSTPDFCECAPVDSDSRASDSSGQAPPDEKEFWDAAPGLTAIRDWARARRAGPYALLGEVLLHVAARIPPQIVLPPLGTGTGTQGCASLNQIYASVGRSGLSKGTGHQLASEIVAWPDPAPVYAPVGSGEGMASTYVACVRDENKQYVMVRLAWSALFAATEISRLEALLGRKNATLGGVLRSVWSGEPIGEANASEERRRYVPRDGYRAGITIHVQPGRGGVLLSADEVAAGTPQRILWLPAPDPDIPDVAPDPPALLTWAPPDPVKAALSVLDQLRTEDQLSHLGSLDLTVMSVCDTARSAIDRAAVARHRGEAGALDGHALLVREKLAAVLGVFLGRFGVTDEDWALAGHLMAVSDATRRVVAEEMRHAAERENEARGKAEARRAQIVDAVRDAAMTTKARKRICDVLGEHKDWMAGAMLRRSLTTNQRDYYDDAIKALLADNAIEWRETANSSGRECRLTTRHPSSPRHPATDLREHPSPLTVTPPSPPAGMTGDDAGVTSDDPRNRRSDWGDGETRRSDWGDGEATEGVTVKAAGQTGGDRGDGVTVTQQTETVPPPCERHAGTGYGPHPQCLACNPVGAVEASPDPPQPNVEAAAENGQQAPIDHPSAKPQPGVSGWAVDVISALTGQSDSPPARGGTQRSPFAPEQL